MTAPEIKHDQLHDGDRRVKVFYDGSCGLCSREIAHYKRLDRERHHIHWIDISVNESLLIPHDVTVDQAMRRLHVLDAQGHMHHGVPAFVTMWAALPYYHLLARIVNFTRTESLLESAYRPFAAWRYNRRVAAAGACPIDKKSINSS